jgi:hypothetical protein
LISCSAIVPFYAMNDVLVNRKTFRSASFVLYEKGSL